MALPTQETFTDDHEETERRLRQYALTKNGRKLIGDAVIKEWGRAGAGALYSNSARARVEFMKALSNEWNYRHSKTRGREFFFLTLTPKMFAVPLGCAADFKHSTLKTWASQLLSGLTYIAFIEAAFFGNVGLVAGEHGQSISWHVHALIWDVDERYIRTIMAAVERDYEPLLPGRKVAHLKRLGARGAGSRIIYMSKGQIKEYRAWPRKQERSDPDTGELLMVLTGMWKYRKRSMRTGDLAKMTEVMAGRTLPTLFFAGGAGRAIWEVAVIRTRKTIAKQNAAAIEKLKPYRIAWATVDGTVGAAGRHIVP